MRFAVVIVVVAATTIIVADNQGGSLAGSWASWNYSGYESKPAWNEYHDLMTRMGSLGKQRGCGRALWEPSAGETDAINNYGTSLALELLPYWTNGCIGSQEGLYFESSATKDAHFLTVSELADSPSNPVRGLVYGTTADFTRGVDHARMLGVRYLMFWTTVSKALADSSPQLVPVMTAPDIDGADPKGWKVYEIRDWGLVAGLDTEPVVATMHAGTRTACLPGSGDLSSGQLDTRLNAWECATDALWMDAGTFGRPVVASGPKSWPHVELRPRRLTTVTTPGTGGGTSVHANGPSMLAPLARLPAQHITPAKVTGVRETASSISFHVDQVGKPVVVRTSYFPNWQVHGADGPYRVAPNLMVVIPRQHDVRLEYGLTGADWLGRVGTLLGLVLLALMIWRWRTVPRAWTTRAAAPHSRALGDDGCEAVAAPIEPGEADAPGGNGYEQYEPSPSPAPWPATDEPAPSPVVTDDEISGSVPPAP